MSKFKVGDIITGLRGAPYGLTTEDAVMEVTEITDEQDIVVKIIEHKKEQDKIGSKHTVSQEYFEKVNKTVVSNNQPVYWECKINDHDKFWAAHIIEKRTGKEHIEYVLVRKWGRIGNSPQTMDQVYILKHEAEDVLKRLIWEKEQKGYKPVF